MTAAPPRPPAARLVGAVLAPDVLLVHSPDDEPERGAPLFSPDAGEARS